jgi:hypothetical protein
MICSIFNYIRKQQATKNKGEQPRQQPNPTEKATARVRPKTHKKARWQLKSTPQPEHELAEGKGWQ